MGQRLTEGSKTNRSASKRATEWRRGAEGCEDSEQDVRRAYVSVLSPQAETHTLKIKDKTTIEFRGESKTCTFVYRRP